VRFPKPSGILEKDTPEEMKSKPKITITKHCRGNQTSQGILFSEVRLDDVDRIVAEVESILQDA